MIRYPTLPSRSSYWTFTLVHYIRRDAPPYFTKSACPGLFHLVGFSCAWARTYYYFLVPADSRCLNTPTPLSSNSQGPQNMGAQKSQHPLRPTRALPRKPKTSSLTAACADRLAHGFSLYNLATTTTSTVVDNNLKMQASESTSVSSAVHRHLRARRFNSHSQRLLQALPTTSCRHETSE